jgi:DNA-binding SARP family transcriptional activator
MRISTPEQENRGVDSSLVRADDGSGSRQPQLEVRLLGGLQIRHHGVPLPLGGQRRQCVLAVLLLNHGRTVSPDDLAEWAWPSTPPDTAGRQIANHTAALRRSLQPVGDRIQLLARHPGFTALVDPELLDTERFTRLATRGRAALSGLRHEPAVDRAEQLLQDLVDHNLLAEPAPGRYRVRDLVRHHARTLATNEPLARVSSV